MQHQIAQNILLNGGECIFTPNNCSHILKKIRKEEELSGETIPLTPSESLSETGLSLFIRVLACSWPEGMQSEHGGGRGKCFASHWA